MLMSRSADPLDDDGRGADGILPIGRRRLMVDILMPALTVECLGFAFALILGRNGGGKQGATGTKRVAIYDCQKEE